MRGLAVYALVLPVALILGYMLATPTDTSSAGTVGIVLGTLALPLILKWHHPVLFLGWQMTAVVFFLPGSPPFWLLMAFLSLCVSFGQRALSKEKQFIWEPSVILPIFCLAIVVLFTAKMTGGFGMRVFGSGIVGGKRYILIFGGIAGFVAMMGQRIPAQKAILYVGLFFLGSIAGAVGSLIPYGPPELYPLSLVFPVSATEISSARDLAPSFAFDQNVTRFFGLTIASLGLLCYVLARGGMRGVLSNFWRLVLFTAVLVIGSSGGFRSFFIVVILTCVLSFYYEGLFRSRYLAWVILLLICVGAILVAFSEKLPLSLQRTLSFLPLKIDPIARFDAEVSSEWRLQMWSLVLPEVPKYLWLGKGLSIDPQELALASDLVGRSQMFSQEVSVLAGDYHSGPLTALIQFGIWGLLTFLWLLGSGVRALYLNYRHGEPYLKQVNTFLLAYFIAKIIFFFGVFGNFYTDVPQFCGMLGLSLALNHGIRRAAKRVSVATEEQGQLAAGSAISAPA